MYKASEIVYESFDIRENESKEDNLENYSYYELYKLLETNKDHYTEVFKTLKVKNNDTRIKDCKL